MHAHYVNVCACLIRGIKTVMTLNSYLIPDTHFGCSIKVKNRIRTGLEQAWNRFDGLQWQDYRLVRLIVYSLFKN